MPRGDARLPGCVGALLNANLFVRGKIIITDGLFLPAKTTNTTTTPPEVSPIATTPEL